VKTFKRDAPKIRVFCKIYRRVAKVRLEAGVLCLRAGREVSRPGSITFNLDVAAEKIDEMADGKRGDSR